jgi:hypothetical protein
MGETDDNIEPTSRADIKETLGGFEMKVQLQSSDVAFDPANIVFITLPRTWTEKEYEKMHKKTPNDYVKGLIDSQTPFIPGIKPYGAWVHAFNPLELKAGSGVLFYDKEDALWKERDVGKIKFRDPHALLKALAEKLGIEEEPLTDEEIKQRLVELSENEVEQRIFDEVLSCLPKIVTRGNFENNPDVKFNIVQLLLKMHQINENPDDSSNREMGLIYDELKEVFSRNIPENQLYRHGRPMLVSECKIEPSISNRGTLILV